MTHSNIYISYIGTCDLFMSIDVWYYPRCTTAAELRTGLLAYVSVNIILQTMYTVVLSGIRLTQ